MASTDLAGRIIGEYAPTHPPYMESPASTPLDLIRRIQEVAESGRETPLDPESSALRGRVCQAAGLNDLFPLNARCLSVLAKIFLEASDRLKEHPEEQALLYKVFVGYVFSRQIPLDFEGVHMILSYAAALGIEETLTDCLQHENITEIVQDHPECVESALWEAISAGHTRIAGVLLDYLNSTGMELPSLGAALLLAVNHKHPDIAALLIRHPCGARIPCLGMNSKASALWHAATLDDRPTFQLLLDDMNEKNEVMLWLDRPAITLFRLVADGNAPLVEMVCTHGVAGKIIIEKDLPVCLKRAMKKGDSTTTLALLKHPHARALSREELFTLIKLAMDKGFFDIAATLLTFRFVNGIPSNGEGSLAELLLVAVNCKQPDLAKKILSLRKAMKMLVVATPSGGADQVSLEEIFCVAARNQDETSMQHILAHLKMRHLPPLTPDSKLMTTLAEEARRGATESVLLLFTYPTLAFMGEQTLEEAFLSCIEKGNIPAAVALMELPEARTFSQDVLIKAKRAMKANFTGKKGIPKEWRPLFQLVGKLLWVQRIESLFFIGSIVKGVRSMARAVAAFFRRLLARFKS